MAIENFYKKNPDFPNRYISPEKLFFYLKQNLGDYISEIGISYLNLPIYQFSFGNGNTKVLAWSQMHGNESNATLAMLDLWEILKDFPEEKEELFSKISLDFIFMLNPDGSKIWTRRNALDIDLNRDFLMESSKEFPLLKQIAKTGNYAYALNLHEQRTIFSTDNIHPATLSFLAPAENKDREITPTRKRSMSVITEIASQMENLIPNHIARYNDEFYPTSTGDNFTKMGIPTILYEGGHFENDYKRENTRKFYTIALYYGLKAISKLNGEIKNWENYFQIPENIESHFDVIYRNVKLNTDFECIIDIAVQFKEVIKEGDEEISFIPMVAEVGDLRQKKGWTEIDCSNRFFKSERKYPKLDAEVDFEIV